MSLPDETPPSRGPESMVCRILCWLAMNALLGLKENWLTSLSIYPPFASKGTSWICIPFKMTKNEASCSIKKIAMGGSAGRTTGIVGRNTVSKKKHYRSVGAKETAFLLPDGPCRSEPDNEMNTLAAEIIKG
jgi:hypothetical protein